MPVELPVKNLAEHCDPFRFDPWGARVKRRHVDLALRDRRFARTPGTNEHAARIAFLVQNLAHDPIEIDVGCPSLGCHAQWIVQDGNHRLAAAIYAGRSNILAIVSGSLEHARQLFGVDCSELP